MSSPSVPKRCALRLLDAYKRWISPLLPRACRFHPTCSQYCREAVEHYGLIRGSWMGFCRLLRCNPLFPGGYDPPRTRAERRGATSEDEEPE